MRQRRFNDDAYLAIRHKLFVRLYRSSLFQRAHQRFRRPDAAAEALHVAILKESKRLVESRYPGSEFHMLFWDEPWFAYEAIFEEAGVSFHRVSEIFPDDWADQRGDYEVHEYDFHPNGKALGLLADYVVAEIVGANGAAESATPAAPPPPPAAPLRQR